MSKRYTAEERLILYKKCLERYKKEKVKKTSNYINYISFGICQMLQEESLKEFGTFTPTNRNNFPELHDQKPVSEWRDVGYWWLNNDFDSRINALKKMIVSVEEKVKINSDKYE